MKTSFTEPPNRVKVFGNSLNACKHGPFWIRAQELCESRDGRPGLSVLTSLTVSVDAKATLNRASSIGHSLSLNMSADIRGHEALLHRPFWTSNRGHRGVLFGDRVSVLLLLFLPVNTIRCRQERESSVHRCKGGTQAWRRRPVLTGVRSCAVKVEVAVPAGLLVPNTETYGFCGRKATLQPAGVN